MTRSGLLRVCALVVWVPWLSACPPLDPEDEAPPADAGADGPSGPLDKGLALERCVGTGGLPDLSGAWIFELETVASVRIGGRQAQAEVVTRIGVAQVCQRTRDVEASLMICDLAQSRLRDPTGNCAAELPGRALLEALPPLRARGRVDRLGPGATLTLGGWRESWGLTDGALIEDGATQVPERLVADQDADGDPGVTLRGDGEVPTETWAVRQTWADFALEVQDNVLAGPGGGSTTEIPVGGPASRLLADRRRQGASGRLVMVRADGTNRTETLDLNGDGVLACAELGRLLPLLPAPTPAGCR